MSLEYKVFAVNSAESGDDGYGYVQGYGNTVFSVDRYGDIVTEYVGLDKLIVDGFVTDTHGLTEGEMGNYTYKGQYGTIGKAEVDDTGLFVKLDFYKNQAAQELRSQIEDRINRKKNVYLSIGWKPAEPPIFVYPSEYKTALPKYLPKDKVQAAIDKATEYNVSRIRLVKAVVSEIAFAPKPVNTESAVTTFKNEMEKLTFIKDKFKAIFLGKDVEERIAISAIDTLYYRMRDAICTACIPGWNSWDYNSTTDGAGIEDEALESLNVNGAIDEFATIAKGVFKKMQELEAEGNPTTDTEAEKSLRERLNFKGDKPRTFDVIYAEFKSIVDSDEFKAGAKHSKATKEQLAKAQQLHTEMKDMATDMADKAQEAYDCMKDMMGDSEEEKAALELMELEYEREQIFSN